MLKILLLGLPGSGKTTIAYHLAHNYHLCMIKTGEILREMVHKNHPLAAQIKAKLDVGEMIEDDLVIKIVKERVDDADCQEGFILDGFPRRLKQLKEYDPGFDYCFYLKVSEQEATKRLMNRGREDDSKAIIEHRLKLHEEKLRDLLGYLKEEGKLIEIDGNRSADEVYAQVKAHIDR